MSRLFLTNIDLNTNELQNAVIQNLSSAPLTGNKEGRIYYDITSKQLYLYTDSAWKPLASGGAAASSIELTGDVTGTASVDPATGKLTVSTTVDSSFVTLTGTQTLTNKTLSGAKVTGTTSFKDNVDVDYLTISRSGTGTARITAADDLALRATNDVILYPGNDVNGHTGKAYIHWGDDAWGAYPDREIATVGTQQDISNKRITDTLYFTDGITISNEGEILVDSGNNQFKVRANVGDLDLSAYDDVNITSNNGNIVLYPDGSAYIGAVAAGNRIATIDDLNSNAVIQSVTGTTNQIDSSTDLNGDVTLSLPSTIEVEDLSIGNGAASTITFNNTAGDIVLTADSGNIVINDNLVTNTILSKTDTADTLSVVADEIILQSPDVKVGGGGTNGKLQVLDSNGTNAFIVNSSDKSAQFGGDVTIDGDLNVNGNLNAVNRTEINIEDNTIRLNTGFTGAPTADAGIIVERGTANDTAIIWSETNDQWTLTNDGSNYYAIARKYVEVIGDASNTSFDVVHNLGTRDITVMVRENNAEYNVVETDILMKDASTVTISFTDAPALNSYKVIIVG
jgi:hypothetical protein